jgi:hypothetical protein
VTLAAPARVAAFVAGLVLVGGAAALAGAAVDLGPGAAPQAMEPMGGAQLARANGLASTAAGYRLVVDRTIFAAGRSLLRFRILGADGAPIRAFDREGGVELHLILARRDLTGYQHLHPRLAGDAWQVAARLPAPGAYRAYADFELGGEKTVLGTDVLVAGRFAPRPLPRPSTRATVDGFDVELAHERLRAGAESRLTFRVRAHGAPVPVFDEYVGHRGHLVALHAGDLAYTHVHPVPTAAPGEIPFDADLAAPGRYRLFVQFKVAGVVHTAPFTVRVDR